MPSDPIRYAKSFEPDSKERDAGLVNELYKKSRMIRTEVNQSAFESAQDWFIKKHKCGWQEFVKESERMR